MFRAGDKAGPPPRTRSTLRPEILESNGDRRSDAHFHDDRPKSAMSSPRLDPAVGRPWQRLIGRGPVRTDGPRARKSASRGAFKPKGGLPSRALARGCLAFPQKGEHREPRPLPVRATMIVVIMVTSFEPVAGLAPQKPGPLNPTWQQYPRVNTLSIVSIREDRRRS